MDQDNYTDQLRQANKSAANGVCDAAGGEHVCDNSARKAVFVQNWGWFSYCGEAIAEDKRRGLNVSLNPTKPTSPKPTQVLKNLIHQYTADCVEVNGIGGDEEVKKDAVKTWKAIELELSRLDSIIAALQKIQENNDQS